MDRSMPYCWYVKGHCGVEPFCDFGLALAYAIKTGGNVVPVFRMRALHETA